MGVRNALLVAIMVGIACGSGVANAQPPRADPPLPFQQYCVNGDRVYYVQKDDPFSMGKNNAVALAVSPGGCR